jgi:ribonuclease Z
MIKNERSLASVLGTALTTAIVSFATLGFVASAQTAAPASTLALQDRDIYYPGTETIAADEMRVVACGTGLVTPRPKQAAACWMVELGNGDKFLFDIGAGSHERIAAQKIPYDYLNKVFIGHLHVDHYGDLASFWLGGTVMNRLVPLRIWGPSGATEELGTASAMKYMQKMYAWDMATRSSVIDARSMELEVNEFDYKAVNKVIYNENGVTVRSIPSIHAIDGAVSYILEWNGLKFSYSSDTAPNRWWLEHTKDSDISIHEIFPPPRLFKNIMGFTTLEALVVSTVAHTSAQQFGKLMSMTKPRLAVGYHFQNDFNVLPTMIQETRKVYDGPLVFPQDYTVFNITKDSIRVRESAIDEDVYAQPALIPKILPAPEDAPVFSPFIAEGIERFPEIVGPMWDEMNKAEGTNYKQP